MRPRALPAGLRVELAHACTAAGAARGAAGGPPAAPPRAATPSQPPRVAHGPPRRRAQSGAAPIASADV